MLRIVPIDDRRRLTSSNGEPSYRLFCGRQANDPVFAGVNGLTFGTRSGRNERVVAVHFPTRFFALCSPPFHLYRLS